MVEARRTDPQGYLGALGVVTLAAFVRLGLTPILGDHYAFATFVVGVLYTAWRFGTRPACLAMGLGGLLAAVLFLPPVGTLSVLTAEHAMGLILYLLIGGVGIAINAVERGLRRRLEEEVAERKRVERALRENESTLQAYCDNAPVCMGIVELVGDDDILHVYDNPATCRFFGVPPGSTAGRLASELGVDRAVMATWRAHYEQSRRTGLPAHFEHEYVSTADRRWLAVTVCPLSSDPARGDGDPPRFCYVAEDNTEARRLSRQLESERSLLDSYFTSTTVAMGLVDAQFRFLRVNEALAETNACPAMDHIGRTVAEVLPELWPSLEPIFEQVLRSGEPVRDREIVCKTLPRGPHRLPEERCWIANYHPVRVDGAIIGVGFAVVETTEARKKSLQVIEAEQRYRLATRAVLGMVYEYDIATGRVERSNGVESIVGFTVEEADPTVAWWMARVHPSDLASFQERLELALRRRSETVESEYRIRHRDGIDRRVWDRALVVYGEDGRAAKMIGCTIDITSRTEAEEKLRRAEDRFRASQEASLFGFSILRSIRDEFGRIVDFSWEYVNPAATAIIRRPADQLIGRRLLELFPEARDKGLFPQYAQLVETGIPHDVELKYEFENEVKWYRNMAVRLGDGVAISFSDITDRKRAEMELRDSDRRKNEFLAMLAHELRNPLAPIRNAIGVLELNENDVESWRWARPIIDRQLRHLTSLVDDLLDVSRINEGKIKLTRVRMDLGSALQAAVEAAQPVIDARLHQFEWEPPTEPFWIDGDGTRLTQVAMNLLTNAAKYTPQRGRIRLDLIREKASNPGGPDHALIRVRDNGNGIPPEMLPKIFDLFVQVERSLDRSEGGLGIGLTLVRRLVEKHGGTVEARSGGPGEGSEFVIRLPLLSGPGPGTLPAPSVNGSDGAAANGSAPAKPQGRQILVVDDSKDSADSLARVLRRMGHSVETAYDGPSACALAQSLVPDLVFLDIGLPGMDGFEVARTFRSDPLLDGVQLIALTGYGTSEDRRRSAEAGFDNHLVKPVDFDALLATLAGRRVGAS